MVLNQNEYTMTSLGFNYQKPPLFLPNQTHPPSFLINKNRPLPSLSPDPSLLSAPPTSASHVRRRSSGGGKPAAILHSSSPNNITQHTHPYSLLCQFSFSSSFPSPEIAGPCRERAAPPPYSEEKFPPLPLLPPFVCGCVCLWQERENEEVGLWWPAA